MFINRPIFYNGQQKHCTYSIRCHEKLHKDAFNEKTRGVGYKYIKNLGVIG